MARARSAARTVGRYQILEELGRGGMATVYLARQTDLDRLVALKELSSFRQSDPAFVHRFLRESRLAGSLSHPNIVTVLDYFEHDETPYIAMEYVEGGSLRPHIGHVSLTQVAGVLEGMLSALDHAERREVVHRDLKPENVMVTGDGRVKITDFGIAKATGTARGNSMLTATGMTVGTPNYMAPEQAMGKEIGPWTDLYSVGVMAFELFVGQVPFADTEEPVAVLMRQVSDPIPPANSVNPEVEPAISDWIGRLLVKDPDERIGTAGEAWDQFEDVMLTLVGPRWRRSARLVPESRRPPDVPTGPYTPPPSEAATPPLTSLDVPQWSDEIPTRRLARDDAPPPPAKPRRRGGRIVKASLAVAALVFVAAAALGRQSDPSTPTAAPAAVPTAAVAGRDMEVRVPAGWDRVARPANLGLPLARPVAVAPHGRAGRGLVEFGMVTDNSASNPSLLPAAFLASIGQSTDAVPARTAVRLPRQGLQAWRYRGLHPVGVASDLTLYTVPTSAGVATIACAAPPGQAAALRDTCDAIAGTLRLKRAQPYTVGPSDAYASSLNATMGQLQQTVQLQKANLEAAQTLAGQAAAAGALATAYSRAAGELAALNLSPADNDANAKLVEALRGAASAYRRAARAATGGDADAYRAASAAIPTATADVNSALNEVRGGGYQPAGGNQPTGGGQATGGGQPAAGDAPAGNGEPSATDQPSAGNAKPQSDVGDSRSDDPSDDQEEN